MSRSLVRRGGFTLLEVMIATMLLVVALVGSIALILGLRSTNRSVRGRDVAYFLAQQALDQIGTIPLSLPGLTTSLPALGPVPTNNDYPLLGNPVVPTTLSCYPMANDIVADRPTPCLPTAMPAAYFVRTWTCCASTTSAVNQGGSTSQTALALPVGSCGLAAPLGSPDTGSGNGAACYVQAEVTWPTENPLAPATPLSATPPSLFVDTDTTAGGALGLSFSNHVYMAELRSM
ncbi:MAG: type IV pilus modification PilV family protein [Deltaproteobacteria bacterium]